MDRAKPNVGDASIYNIWYNNWFQAERTKGYRDSLFVIGKKIPI